MNKVEGILLWISLFSYFIGFVFFLSSLVLKKGSNRYGLYLTMAGFLINTLSMSVRWYVSGHPPVQGNYENALLGGWFLVLVYIISSIKIPKVIHLGAFTNPIAMLIIGLGFRSSTKVEALAPPYQNNWLWIHVGFSWLGFSAFVVAFVMGIIYLFKFYRYDVNDQPYLSRLEDLMLAYIIFGFISQMFSIASGAIWASTLWGKYWSWDPLETWSLIYWLTYGIIIHLRLTWGLQKEKMAWMSVLGIVTAIISFWGIGVGKGIHTPLL